jgi:hypothetical protein
MRFGPRAWRAEPAAQSIVASLPRSLGHGPSPGRAKGVLQFRCRQL